MLYFIITTIALLILIATPAQAFCPVCTIAVGAGVGLSRWLGIDDTITGVWIGALTVSMIMWTINWLKKKNYIFKGYKIIIALVFYGLIIIPLYYTDLAGHPFNTLWGFDKLVLSIGLGSLVFLFTGLWYEYLKKKNNDHAYFPYQKVVMPVSSAIILSIIFYFITK